MLKFFCIIALLLSNVNYANCRLLFEQFRIPTIQDSIETKRQYLDVGERIPDGQADVIVVFENYDGTSAKYPRVHWQRIDRAVELYLAGKAKTILVLGGARENAAMSMGTLDYVVARGISRQDVLMDTLSGTTYENMQNSLLFFQQLNAKSLIFVSSPYHLERIFRYFDKITKDLEDEFHIYWAAYDHHLDDVNRVEKAQLINHEIHSIWRDFKEFANQLQSEILRAINRRMLTN